MNKTVIYSDLGLVDYQKAWDFQEKIFKEIVDTKINNRKNPESQQETSNYLFFCEHPHVYTLGKSGSMDHLLINEQLRAEKQISFYKINRGGDITYHGPGQIVGYPILDLDHFFTDIHKYLRFLEEAVILTLEEYGLKAGRIDGLTGVWLDYDNPAAARKICAMGVKCSRWVTMHGFAFNINTDLKYFDYIVPCGISDKKVASLHLELNRPIDESEVKSILLKKLELLFEMNIQRENISL